MYPATHITTAVAATWLANRVARKKPDYRLVALGSLIPDLIDKPLYLLARKRVPDDHTIGHTLLTPALLLAAGTALAKRGEPRLLWLAVGAATHAWIDPVARYPKTLFWPFLGLRFPRAKGWLPLGAALGIEAALIAGGLIAARRPDLRERFLARLTADR